MAAAVPLLLQKPHLLYHHHPPLNPLCLLTSCSLTPFKRKRTTMELINNGVNVFFLLLALSSSLLSFSANAICLPRNSSEFQSPVASLAPLPPPISDHVSVVPSDSPPESSGGLGLSPLKVTGGLDNLQSNLMAVTSSAASSGGSELVKICDVTSNPQLCTKSISSHLHGSVDPVSALKTEIAESIKEVEKAIAKLDELRKDSSTSNIAIECFDTCQENFDSAIDDLKAGLESIDGHDAGRMESVLTAVLTDLMTCDDTFAEMGVDSPLDDLTTKINKYASNCLAISKLLL